VYGRAVRVHELTTAAAGALAAAVARRDVAAAELVAAALERIEATAATVNAVVQADGERALATAALADARLARGEPARVLEGVPFTAKDNLEAAGLPMAIGVPARRGLVPDRDATVVARLRAAGAILVGKTNCPPWGGGIETDNPVYGRTSNPYDLARTPGGSSGGEAAAVASGCSALGVGTDSGASVRLPAHFCGLAALKPTAGLVPVSGAIDDEGPFGGLADPRTQVGPLARTVADVALALRVIAGPDGRDGGTVPLAVGDPAAVDLRGARVAIWCEQATAATAAAVAAAGAALRAAGARVAAEAIPPGGHAITIDVWRSYGDEVSAPELYAILRRWDAYRGAMAAFATTHDLVLCPTFAGPAPLHGQTRPPGTPEPTGYTTPFSLAGWPAATVRAGTSPEGLPIGVQLAAPPWRDDAALAAAAAVEAALGGFSAPPAQHLRRGE
jgi:amidase